MKAKGFIQLASIFFLILALIQPSFADDKKPKLGLQITVDQLRGDLPMRFKKRFGKGGFQYLLENGTHYQHANTETAVGHATLATGADPSRHGIIANDWIDQQKGEFVYNTEDDRHHIIGSKPKPHKGVSSRNLLAAGFKHFDIWINPDVKYQYFLYPRCSRTIFRVPRTLCNGFGIDIYKLFLIRAVEKRC